MIGFRALKRHRQVAPDVVAKFTGLPVVNIGDPMSRMSAAGAALRPLPRGGAVYAAASAMQKAEERQMAAILAGTNDRGWIDKSLARLGCERED